MLYPRLRSGSRRALHHHPELSRRPSASSAMSLDSRRSKLSDDLGLHRRSTPSSRTTHFQVSILLPAHSLGLLLCPNFVFPTACSVTHVYVSNEGTQSSDRFADDQVLHLVRPFIGVEGFRIRKEAR